MLIDADVLAYRAAQKHEEVVEVEEGYWTISCDLHKVIDECKSNLDFFLRELEADEYILCLTDDNGNFRKSVAGTYKEKRNRLKRPIVLKPTRAWLLAQGGVIIPDLEGDDVMGIIATDPTRTDQRVIVSIDKDMKTIPGHLFIGGELIHISPEEADYNHLYQTLVGDTIDGYSGCPGIGAVSAKRALDKDPSWDTVVKLFQKAKLDEDYALTQARMAKILHYKDFDQETQRPILWNPPSSE